MKIPTLVQWNALPSGTYALVTLQGEDTRWNVLKHEDPQDVTVASTWLVSPATWAGLHPHVQSVELAYVPGGAPDFRPGPTLSMGELPALLEEFPSGNFLRMRVNGELAAPGRPFHHRATDREVSLNMGAMRITVGEFLEQLAEYTFLDREPYSPLEISPDLPVRIRDRNRLDDDAWSITGAHRENDLVYLDLE